MTANTNIVKFESDAALSRERHSAREDSTRRLNSIQSKVGRPRSLSHSSSHSLPSAMDRKRRWNTEPSDDEIERPNDIGLTIIKIKEQWQRAKETINSPDIPPSSHIALLLSTDPSIFEAPNLSIELNQLEEGTSGPKTPLLLSDVEELLPSKLDDLKLNLTGDDLPKDIVETLIEAVPTNEDKIDSFSSISWFTQPLRKLYEARSLLKALPTWEIRTEAVHAELAEAIFNQVQEDLVDRIISLVSDISTQLLVRLDNDDVGSHLRLPVEVVRKSIMQLHELRFSQRLAPLWPDLKPTCIKLAGEYTSLSRYMEAKSRPSSTKADLAQGHGWKEICSLRPVYFLIHIVEEDTESPTSNDSLAMSNGLVWISVRSLLCGLGGDVTFAEPPVKSLMVYNAIRSKDQEPLKSTELLGMD